MRRAAYDIGSATTKMKTAIVDRCERRIVRVLMAAEEPVFYHQDVIGQPPRFSEATMERGLQALRKLQGSAAAWRPSEYIGVATAAFRAADNGNTFLERIFNELNIHVELITQEDEARLGFLAAVKQAGIEASRVVVWDVGGASMEMSAVDDDGRMMVYLGNLASGQMLEVMQHLKELPKGRSPNPLEETDEDRGRDYAAAHARQNVPQALRDKLDRPDTVVLGVGAIQYFADGSKGRSAVVCTQVGLERRIDGLLGKTDREIGSEYATTAVSDRALVLGYMIELGIQIIHLADVNLTDMVLLDGTSRG